MNDFAHSEPVEEHAPPTFMCTFGTYRQPGPWTDVQSPTWAELATLLTSHEVGPKEGTCVVPAIFSGPKRTKDAASRIDVVILDSDAGGTLSEIRNAIAEKGWSAVISSTHSHLNATTKVRPENWRKFCSAHEGEEDLPRRYLVEEKGYLARVAAGATVACETDEFIVLAHQPCPKFRVVLPLRRPWEAVNYSDQHQANAAWKERYGALAGVLGLSHDQSCTDTSRAFFLPRRSEDGHPPETAILEGDLCDIFALPQVEPPSPDGRGGARAYQNPGSLAFTDPVTGETVDLRRWAADYGHRFQITAALTSRRPEVFVPRAGEHPKRHLRCVNESAHTQAGADAATFVIDASDSTNAGGFVYHCRHAHCDGRDRLLFLKQMGDESWLEAADLTDPNFLLPPDQDANLELTEHGVALHFAREHRDGLRYCHTTSSWYMWLNGRWAKDETRLALHWARQVVASLNRQSDRRILFATGKAAFAQAVEKFAAADEVFAVTAKVWDPDPWLLGTPGGVVDLRTGYERPAERCDMITKITAVAPADEAKCSSWLAFLDEATGHDQELVGFLQRWFGYCLTGVTSEHALLFVYGPGGNGKSVLLSTIAGIMGEYATNAAMDTFTATKTDRHPTELAMLRGARLVQTTETEEGRAWAEARIKALTGGDLITARFMRQDFFTFVPAFKLTISGNHKPALRNVDDAARRRFNIVPFTHKPSRPDPGLLDALKAEWPSILRWMIEGCMAWQKDGLGRPEAVLHATAEYFAEQDVLAQWLDECCDQGQGFGATSAALFASWRVFAANRAEDVRNAKWFATMLERQGFYRIKDCKLFRGRGFLGLRLKREGFEQHWDPE